MELNNKVGEFKRMNIFDNSHPILERMTQDEKAATLKLKSTYFDPINPKFRVLFVKAGEEDFTNFRANKNVDKSRGFTMLNGFKYVSPTHQYKRLKEAGTTGYIDRGWTWDKDPYYSLDFTENIRHNFNYVMTIVDILAEVVRQFDLELRVNSLYRSDNGSTTVDKSWHKQAGAVDLTVLDKKGNVLPDVLFAIINTAIALGWLPNGELLIYTTFVHYSPCNNKSSTNCTNNMLKRNQFTNLTTIDYGNTYRLLSGFTSWMYRTSRDLKTFVDQTNFFFDRAMLYTHTLDVKAMNWTDFKLNIVRMRSPLELDIMKTSTPNTLLTETEAE